MNKLIELDNIVNDNKKHTVAGHVASYIPELSQMDPQLLGVTVHGCDGTTVSSGDAGAKFTIQSISKPLVLIQALLDLGEERVFEKVGMEPTGDPFNSMVRLETFQNWKKPFNPMINAGAIAVTGLIEGYDAQHKIDHILSLIRRMANNPEIKVNQQVYLSEKETGNRNRAMAYFMKDLGVLEGNVEDVLDLYFMHCAIEADTRDLARIASVLACGGFDAQSGKQIFSKRIARIVNAFMITCGMYDASGEFAVNVGLPSKSGVGGGILTVVPGQCGIGVFGPALDAKGNSAAGVPLLADLARKMDYSIF